jgi:TetR/AcrR family transcriptional regulator
MSGNAVVKFVKNEEVAQSVRHVRDAEVTQKQILDAAEIEFLNMG